MAQRVVSLTYLANLDFIADPRLTTSVEREVIRRLLAESIEEALSELPPLQSHVLRLRFGLSGIEPLSPHEVGERLGISDQRVAELEGEALDRLREPRLAWALRDYTT